MLNASQESKNLFYSRSENAIKNKFYGTLRKLLRKVNEAGKSHIQKFSKPIKYEALMRVLDARWGLENLPETLAIDADELRTKTINFCQN